VHVRQVQVEADDVVIVELAEVQALFAKVGGIDVEPFAGEHQLDALGGGRLVFDQQNAHGAWPLSLSVFEALAAPISTDEVH
jgi:hypothetical protein